MNGSQWLISTQQQSYILSGENRCHYSKQVYFDFNLLTLTLIHTYTATYYSTE